jgi:2-pyrone-4,6-dicarboxylate lactonase
MAHSDEPNSPPADPAAPYCAPFDPNPRKPHLVLPPSSCDCHAHICGPSSAYAYAPERIYTPPDSLLPDYRAMLSTVGVERCVLVQPSVYGADNTVMLAAMAESALPCRGVAVVEAGVSDAEIARLHQAGVRGLRFNLVDVRDPTGNVDLEGVTALARRVRPLGWHVEFLMHADGYPDVAGMFDGFPTDIVLGHLGYMRPPLDIGSPQFQRLLDLVRGGRCWIKLTGPSRISGGEMPHADVIPVARALVEAAPERMVWGSDWPHVKLDMEIPNDGDLVDLLAEWIPDAAVRRRVLTDNPTQLYDFAEAR